MKEDNGAKENSDNSLGGFGFLRRMFPNMLRGKDTSENSSLKRTFSRIFGSDSTEHSSQHKSKSKDSIFGFESTSSSGHNLQNKSKSKGPTIEEVDNDAEELLEDKKGRDTAEAAWSNGNPIVELPEDQDKDDGKSTSNSRDILYTTSHKEEEKQIRSVGFKRVTYGGINGAYYTATTTHVTNNGLTLEETKQADRSTGQATHKISRGIDSKGHSLLRRLNSDGKVDTTQIMHNLNEDELLGFEKAWENNADRHLQGWNGELDFPRCSGNIGKANDPLVAWGSFPDPFKEQSNRIRAQSFNHSLAAQSSHGRPKRVVTINIE